MTKQNSINNLYYSMSPYIVGSDTQSQYTTIQSAINQAVADGASASNVKQIYIKPGTYTENLTISTGIYLISFSPPFNVVEGGLVGDRNMSVKIVGTIGITSVLNGSVRLDGLLMETTGITVSGTAGIFVVVFNSCIFLPAGGTFLTASCQCAVTYQNVYADGGGTLKLFNITGAGNTSVIMLDSSITSASSNSVLASGSGLTWDMDNCQISCYGFTCGTASPLQVTGFETVFAAGGGPITPGGTGNRIFSFLQSPVSAQFSCPAAASNYVRFINCSLLSEGDVAGGINYQFINCTSASYGSSSSAISNSQKLINNATTPYTGSSLVTEQAFVQSTTDTGVIMFSVVVNENEACTLTGTVVGAPVDHSQAAGGSYQITAYRGSGGDIILAGAAVNNIQTSSGGTGQISIDVATQSIIFTVEGDTDVVFNWVATYQYQKVLQAT